MKYAFCDTLDHHNSKSKLFKEERLHLKCSTDRYFFSEPLTKKIKWVVKEKNHFENNKFGWTTHFVALLDHHNSRSKMFRGKRLHLKCSTDKYLFIKPLTKKIKWVVKEKTLLKKAHFWNFGGWKESEIPILPSEKFFPRS